MTLAIDAIVVTVPVPGDDSVDVTLWRDGMVIAGEIGDESCADGAIDWAAMVGTGPGEGWHLACAALTEATPRLVALARGVFGEGWGTVADVTDAPV